MRKNLLSLSIAAMIGGLGLAGSAGAVSITNPAVTANGVTVGAATAIQASTTGVGHILLVPYFSAQNGNATLLSIVNSDTSNGKAVKVRFRGAANSDDLLDFQLFLSPGDVWTANVSMNATTGVAQLTTSDASCMIPNTSGAAVPFSTYRLPAVSSTFTAAQQQSWTREGYVEIFNMADIPSSSSTTSLYYAIKHVNGVPPGCPSQTNSATILSSSGLLASAAGVVNAVTAGLLTNPTTGLFGGATIINTAGAAVAWSGNDYALKAVGSSAANNTGNIVFSPQLPTAASTDYGSSVAAAWTADPLMTGGALTLLDNDIPDLSTPYVGTAYATPTAQAVATAGALATLSVMNEYLVTPSIAAATDWTFTLATRRYSAAYNYAGTQTTTTNTATSKLWLNSAETTYFTSANVTVGTGATPLLCVSGMTMLGYSQEEQTMAGTGFVFSPNPATPGFNLCGEASVLSFQAASVLGSTVAQTSITSVLPAAQGWMSIATPGATGVGLPVLGSSYEQATGNPVAGKSTNFGISYQHRYIRPANAF